MDNTDQRNISSQMDIVGQMDTTGQMDIPGQMDTTGQLDKVSDTLMISSTCDQTEISSEDQVVNVLSITEGKSCPDLTSETSDEALSECISGNEKLTSLDQDLTSINNVNSIAPTSVHHAIDNKNLSGSHLMCNGGNKSETVKRNSSEDTPIGIDSENVLHEDTNNLGVVHDGNSHSPTGTCSSSEVQIEVDSSHTRRCVVQNGIDSCKSPSDNLPQKNDGKRQQKPGDKDGSHEAGEYRTMVISDSDTSTDSDSDSSSSDTDSEDSQTVVTDQVETNDKGEKIHSDQLSDEEISGPKRKEKSNKIVPRTKGELLPEELPPLDELKITINPDVELVHIGIITSVIGVLAIIQSNKNIPPLDDDTILFLEGRIVLGQIFEVFGPVGHPWYSVRFNSIEDIHKQKITVGLKVFCAPRVEELTKYVFVEHLKMMKGSDASWEDNNEPPAQYLDYSDDEQEKSAKSKNRRKNKGEEEDANVLPGARVPKRKRNKDRYNKNDSVGDTRFQEGNKGNNFDEKSNRWGGNQQSESGDPSRTNCYQTFQPFGRSPQFRPRPPMNRPPLPHRGPIRPSYFQPRNVGHIPPFWQPEGGGNFSAANGQNFPQNSWPRYNNSNWSSSYVHNTAPPWSDRPNFGEHNFPGCNPRPFQNVAPNSNFAPSSGPPFNRIVDNRLVQNNSQTEYSSWTPQVNVPPDFSTPPPGYSQAK